MIEHEEGEQHEVPDGSQGPEQSVESIGHDDVKHQEETALYLSIFAIIRLVIYFILMLSEESHSELSNYLVQNWFEVPAGRGNIENLKKYVLKVSSWTA
jgi:hypothetical protein